MNQLECDTLRPQATLTSIFRKYESQTISRMLLKSSNHPKISCEKQYRSIGSMPYRQTKHNACPLIIIKVYLTNHLYIRCLRMRSVKQSIDETPSSSIMKTMNEHCQKWYILDKQRKILWRKKRKIRLEEVFRKELGRLSTFQKVFSRADLTEDFEHIAPLFIMNAGNGRRNNEAA